MPKRAGPKESLSKAEQIYLKRIGLKISDYASKEGISIERLAYEAGVSKGYLYDIVKGNGNPSAIILNRLADSLDISVGSFFKD